MASIHRTVLQVAALTALAPVALAQTGRPASEATAFFKKYDPTRQLFDAVRKEGVAGGGGGGGGGSPADRKHCEGQFTGTPAQADRLFRRLHTGVVATGKETGAKLHGPKELARDATTFRIGYEQGNCVGEVAVRLTRGEATSPGGSFRYTVAIILVEANRPTAER